MGRRPGETPDEEAAEAEEPRGAGLAAGSEVHTRSQLEAQVAIEGMLQAYLRDQDHVPSTASAELILYVVDDSESCEKARRTLERAVRRYPIGSIAVSIRNLTRGPLAPEDRKVVVVPTVMMLQPRLVYLPGDLHDDAAALHDLLRLCGLTPISSSRR
jgi:hypothetical protein